MIYLDSYTKEWSLIIESMAIGSLENYGDEVLTPFGVPDGETRRFHQEFITSDKIGRCNLRGDSIDQDNQDFFYPVYQFTEDDIPLGFGYDEYYEGCDFEPFCEPSEEDGVWLELYLAKQEDDLGFDRVFENSFSIQSSPEIQGISIVRSSHSSRRMHAGNHRSYGRRGRK